MALNNSFGQGFPPRSIGIVGVSEKEHMNVPGYTGLRIFRMIRDADFLGRVYPINPKVEDIDGVKAYPSVTSISEQLDLVIIAVPAEKVPQVLEECVKAKALNVQICTSGFAETGTTEGKSLENGIREIATNGGLRVIGPNCMGFHVPSVNLKMFDEVEDLVQGPVAFVSQSGGHTQTFLMNASDYDIGFSKAISYGNALTLNAEDFLEFFATDLETQIICMYVEGVKDGKRFFEKVRETNIDKPIIILKGGNTESGSRAVASHTGSMAGDKKIWDAFFKQTGAIQVGMLEEMVEVTLCFLQLPPLIRLHVAVIGVGGGSTVANGDICTREGLVIPALSPKTITRLTEFIPLVNQGIANPLDIPSVLFHNETLLKTLNVLNDDSNVDVLLLSIPAGIMSGVIGDVMTGFKACLNQFVDEHPEGKPIVVAMSNEFTLSMTELCLRELRDEGITVFPSLTKASRALKRFSDYHKFLARRGFTCKTHDC